jgi:hypothetical protein
MSRKVLIGLGVVMLALVANVIRRKIISGRVPGDKSLGVVTSKPSVGAPRLGTDSQGNAVSYTNRPLTSSQLRRRSVLNF